MSVNYSLALVSSLPLPSAESFVSGIQAQALPQVLGLGGACLGVMVAVLLIRSLKGL